MARGYPDFFGISIFPHFGGAKENDGSLVVDANVHNTLFAITGKGHIYSIEVTSRLPVTVINDNIELWVDGHEFSSIKPSSAILFGPQYGALGMWDITRYEPSANAIAVSLHGIITFAASFSVLYDEQSGNTPTVGWTARYSLLQ